MATKHFSSKKAYNKWLAYGHMHTKKGLLVKKARGRKSLFSSTPGHQKIVIAGKLHRVKHTRY